MRLVVGRGVELARGLTASSAQGIDRTALRDGAEPGRERPVRVIGVANAVNREQDILHDIVDTVLRHALPLCHRPEHGNAVA